MYLIELKNEIKSANSLIGNKKLNAKIKEVTNSLSCKSIKERVFCILNDILEIPKCECCSKDVKFDKLKNRYSRFCGTNCYNKWRKEDKQKRIESTNESLLQNKDEYIECKICGSAVKAIAAHLKLKDDELHKDWDLVRYKKEYPNEPIVANNTSKILSEQSKGENNGMHRSKTTKEFRQSISPFSIEFYRRKYPNETSEQQEKRLKEFIGTVDYENRLTETQLEYWIEKCDDIEQANELYKERQTTFTKEKCINKYGKEKGLQVFIERQEKWLIKLHDNFINEGDGRNNGSMIANELFNIIQEKTNIIQTTKEKFIYDNSHKYGNGFSYDFTCKKQKKIIEFNGDFWHCNPTIYDETYYNKTKKKTAKELWEYDKYKKELAESYGYKVLTIWESDFKKHKKETIQQCVDFLKE